MHGLNLKCLRIVVIILTAFWAQNGHADAQGDFFAKYLPTENPELGELQSEIRGSRFLEDVVDQLNQLVALPQDVAITFADCGQANAFYDPESHTITMCYELVAYTEASLRPEAKNEAELEEAVIGVTYFFLFHELGHALVDVLKLPITGMEEDAVDQLSAAILLTEAEFRQTGADALVATAAWFYKEAEQEAEQTARYEDLPFYGEHSLSPVRFFNLLCWAYGSDPDRFTDLKTAVIPEDRAVQCPREFSRFEQAWSTLLAPHMKK